jgi:esterase/lipase superfamily enzyme
MTTNSETLFECPKVFIIPRIFPCALPFLSNPPHFHVKYCNETALHSELTRPNLADTIDKAIDKIRIPMSVFLLVLFLYLLVFPASAQESSKLNLAKTIGLAHHQTVLQNVLVAPPSVMPGPKVEPVPLSRENEKGQHRFATIPIFYATTRLPDDDKELSYGKARGSKLDYGVCDVTQPIASDEQRSLDYFNSLGWKTSEKAPHTFGSPKRFDSPEELFAAIKQIQSQSSEKRLIVFVHGYAASFNKAARIGARLAYGTGIPVLIFSWPTQHNPFIYTADECNAEWTYPRFQQFLSILNAHFPKEEVTLISHSMGARIVSWSLQWVQRDSTADNMNHPRYQHIFFCCPDIDKDTFAAYADRIESVSKDTVVYVSGNDFRLGFSELLHGHARLGEFGNKSKDMMAIPGVETIDFTALDSALGHAMPYPLIFKAMNHDVLPPGIQLVPKNNNNAFLEVVKIAGKH